MGFILHGLDTEAYDRNYSDRELLSRIIGYFRPHTRQMVIVAAMITLNSAAGTGGPILISRALDIMGENPASPFPVHLRLADVEEGLEKEIGGLREVRVQLYQRSSLKSGQSNSQELDVVVRAEHLLLLVMRRNAHEICNHPPGDSIQPV